LVIILQASRLNLVPNLYKFSFRSIKDKSVLFDNSLKELKDQMTEVQYKSEQEVRTLAQQLNRVQARDQATTHITGTSTCTYINPRQECAKKL
jgi:hypothetical protein